MIEIKEFKHVVKQQEAIRIEALITAWPTPEISWAFDGKPIGGSACVPLEKGLCRVEFIKANVNIHDGGIYKISASNECGTAFAEAKIMVGGEYLF